MPVQLINMKYPPRLQNRDTLIEQSKIILKKQSVGRVVPCQLTQSGYATVAMLYIDVSLANRCIHSGVIVQLSRSLIAIIVIVANWPWRLILTESIISINILAGSRTAATHLLRIQSCMAFAYGLLFCWF